MPTIVEDVETLEPWGTAGAAAVENSMRGPEGKPISAPAAVVVGPEELKAGT